MTDVSTILGRLIRVFDTGSKRRGDFDENGDSNPTVTNFLFRLHSKLTSTFLLLSAMLVIIQQLFKVHMSCLVPPKEDARPSAIVQYCFITGTYTVPRLYSQSHLTPHYGIGNSRGDPKEEKYHHYFQWVPFVLLIQGVLFYLPNLFWKSVEKGHLELYTSHKVGSRIASSSAKNKTNLQRTAIYFAKSQGYNKTYGMTYVLCEFLNLVCVVITFYTTDWFLGGQFQSLGFQWINHLNLNSNDGINPVHKVFPKVSKCQFQKFGPSGGIIKYDILCILTLNVINEKIYLILWFWLIILFILDLVGCAYRIMLMTSKSFRSFIIQKKDTGDGLKYLLKNIGYCDWFLLKRIADTMDKILLKEFCDEICYNNQHLKQRHVFSPRDYDDDYDDDDYEKQFKRYQGLRGNHEEMRMSLAGGSQRIPQGIRFGGFGDTRHNSFDEGSVMVRRSLLTLLTNDGGVESTTNTGGGHDIPYHNKRLQSDQLPPTLKEEEEEEIESSEEQQQQSMSEMNDLGQNGQTVMGIETALRTSTSKQNIYN